MDRRRASTAPPRPAPRPGSPARRAAASGCLPRPRSRTFDTAPIRRAKRAASGVSSAATAVATRNANTASQAHGLERRMAAGEDLSSWPSARAIVVITAMRPVAQLYPGDSYDAISGGDQLLIAPSVALECGSVAVVGVAVHLDDEALGGPNCVDHEAEHRLVEERTIEVGVVDQIAQDSLGARAGVAAVVLGVEEAADDGGARAGRGACDDCVDLAVGGEAVDRGLRRGRIRRRGGARWRRGRRLCGPGW